MTYQTEQESFWANEFGNDYISRNDDRITIAHRCARWAKIFARTNGVDSIIELGANIGLNLKAFKILMPNSKLSGIEINETAYQELQKINGIHAYNKSILEIDDSQLGKHCLSFTSGVLIHINPAELQTVYEKLYSLSSKYICVMEYYNPTPVMIPDRGHDNRLFKRDFAGELLDKYSDLSLVDYGFVYHRDSTFPADDTTWFLLEKK